MRRPSQLISVGVFHFLLEIGPWLSVREQFPVALVVNTLHQWELDLGVVELLDMHTTRLRGWNRFHLDDLNGVGAGTMTSAHVTVALCDGTPNGQITVLAVHVVCARTRIVAQPYAEILNLDWRRFVYLFQGDDFAGGFLELLQLTQKVPETGFGDNVVRSEYTHFIQRRLWLLLAGQLTANDLVFLQLQANKFVNKLRFLYFYVNNCGKQVVQTHKHKCAYTHKDSPRGTEIFFIQVMHKYLITNY